MSGFNYSITSLAMDVERGGTLYTTQSRLFVDKAGTANNYGNGLRFTARDIGTAENAQEDYWFRPVAMDKDGKPIEGGQLEAGKFLFDFGKTLESLSLDFFDVESTGVVGSSAGTWGRVTKVNGETVDFTIDSGRDRAISGVTFENVSSLEVMFGNPNNSGEFDNDKNWGTGDGVLLRGEYKEAEVVDVPEPGLLLGLLAVSLGGVAARKRARIARASVQ